MEETWRAFAILSLMSLGVLAVGAVYESDGVMLPSTIAFTISHLLHSIDESLD